MFGFNSKYNNEANYNDPVSTPENEFKTIQTEIDSVQSPTHSPPTIASGLNHILSPVPSLIEDDFLKELDEEDDTEEDLTEEDFVENPTEENLITKDQEDSDSDSDENESITPEFKLKPDKDIFIVLKDSVPQFYSTNKADACDKMLSLARFYRSNLGTDYNVYLREGNNPDKIQLFGCFRFFIVSYERLIISFEIKSVGEIQYIENK